MAEPEAQGQPPQLVPAVERRLNTTRDWGNRSSDRSVQELAEIIAKNLEKLPVEDQRRILREVTGKGNEMAEEDKGEKIAEEEKQFELEKKKKIFSVQINLVVTVVVMGLLFISIFMGVVAYAAVTKGVLSDGSVVSSLVNLVVEALKVLFSPTGV